MPLLVPHDGVDAGGDLVYQRQAATQTKSRTKFVPGSGSFVGARLKGQQTSRECGGSPDPESTRPGAQAAQRQRAADR